MAHASDTILDYAIVGGGVAGTYCAWRLAMAARAQAASDRPKIALFEGSQRIGGRLLSLVPPGMPHLTCELGGMFFANTHTRVRALVTHLGLPTQTMPHLAETVAYVRGRRLPAPSLSDPDQVPYTLAGDERGQAPGALLGLALERLVPGLSTLNGPALQDALHTAQVDGRPLADWGLWNLLYRVISPEAYAFIHDTGGDDYMLFNWNAVDLINQCALFGPGVVAYHLQRGFQQLPLTLADRFKQAGGAVYLGHRLRAFDVDTLPDGAPGVRLSFEADSAGWAKAAAGAPRTVYARALVLAMPRRALELLDATGRVMDVGARGVRRLLTSVSPIRMVKLFLCYPEPWWERLGLRYGRAVTDLPIRQCLYWGTEGEQEGADPANRNALLLASLSDMLEVDFWAGLNDTDRYGRFAPGANAHRRARPGSRDWPTYRARATGALVDEAHRQLTAIHGLVDLPRPYDAAFMDWSSDPYGGAGSFWLPGARSWELIPQVAQPVAGVPVYICGEAYSSNQGWVEGALETAELILQRHLRLAPPVWLAEG